MQRFRISTRKAKKILGEKRPTLQGKPITEAQRGALGVIAGGGKLTRLKHKSSHKSKHK